MDMLFDSKKNSKQVEQVNVYKKLKEVFKENLEANNITEFCIINNQWYHQWKKTWSLNMNISVKKTDNLSITSISDSLKEINNNELGNSIPIKQIFPSYDSIFTGTNNFFIQNSPTQQCIKEVFIINESMKQNIKIISKEIWNFFYKLYEGGPRIERHITKEALQTTNKKKLLLCQYVFHKRIQFYILIKDNKARFSYYLFSKEENYFYIEDGVTITQIKEAIVKSLLELFKLNYCKIWRLDEEKRNVFVNWIKGKADIFNNNQKSDFSGELLNIYPHFNEFNKNDFLIIEIGYEREGADISHCLTTVEPFLNQKDKKHYTNGNCTKCHTLGSLMYTCQCKKDWFCSVKCYEDFKLIHSKHKCVIDSHSKNYQMNNNSLKGLAGIKNLGTTCYMNAAIQCLSNLYELSGYFLSKSHKQDGDVVKQYSSILQKLHFGNDKVISIQNLRNSIGKKNTMFLGNTQEDSEEFLMAIINSLHEELNKPKKVKLYKENNNEYINSNGQKELLNYIQNNQSIISNLFVGQFRSSLQCFKCKHISHNFDIFLCLSLPIPTMNNVSLEVYFIYFDLTKGIAKLTITIESDLHILDLRNAISVMINIHPMSFIIGSLRNLSIEMIYNNTTPLNELFSIDPSMTSELKIACFQFDTSIFGLVDNKFYKCDTNKMQDSFDNSTNETDFAFKKLSLADINTETHETYYSNSDPSFIELYSPTEYCLKDPDLNRTLQNMSSTIINGKHLDENLQQNIKRIILNTISSSLKVYTDENYGFNNHYIKTFLRFKVYCDQGKIYPYRRKEISFQRVIYIKLKWSLLYLEKYLQDNFTINTNCHPEIRIINPNKNKFNQLCYVCNTNCVNCLLSNVRGVATVENLLALYPINNYNKKHVDNSYLYYDLSRRKLTTSKCDFELELCYNSKDISSITKTLLQMKPYVSKSISSEGQKNSKKEIDIYDCLKKFGQKEMLEDANKWFCSKCNSHQKAIKKIQLNYSPNMLVLQFKRFKSCGNNGKIENFIKFPVIDFLLKNYNVQEKYDLCGIINHTGTIGFGHYVAICKNYYNNKWYQYDDSIVTEIEDEKLLVTKSAYVLFYKKKNFNYDKAKLFYDSETNRINEINEAFSQFKINYLQKEQQQEEENKIMNSTKINNVIHACD